MDPMTRAHLRKGVFLISTPEVDSGVYFRAVILLCEHSPAGSFGLMINKPLDVEIPDEILPSSNLANHRIEIRAGGPMQPSQMMLLHTASTNPEETIPICEDVFLGGGVQFLQESVQGESGLQIRLCFGYAGWGPSQLEKECASNLWFVHPASKAKIFDTAPEACWKEILQEMGGKYASLALMPEDLSLN